MTKRERALVDAALLVYELWAERRIMANDEGASIHFNQFFETLKKYPGYREAFQRGLDDAVATLGRER